MRLSFRTKVSAAALFAAVGMTAGAAVAHASPGDGTGSVRPAIAIQAKLLPDPCGWDVAPAPPTLELTASRPATPSSEKGIACPIERHS